ncbi:putative peptidase (DUF1758) [Popillia japonica]|uniref:Peptidase (DUF1758) n=1 Tax=Popillia japonica TaxID=7064 RepID=A0AAW1I714_POPJA
MFIVTSKLDKKTYSEWEKHANILHTKASITDIREFLTNRANLLETLGSKVNDIREFLTNRANLLETLGSKVNDSSNDKKDGAYGNYSKNKRDTKVLFAANSKCVLCSKEHSLQTCSDFHKLNVKNRMEQVRKFRLCVNCLKGGHFSRQCRSSMCRKCGLKHNTLLHDDKIVDKQSQNESKHTSENSENEATCLSSYNSLKHVLLSTAYIQVMDHQQKLHTARAVLDSGSQSSYITSDLCNKLKLPKESIELAIAGINNTSSK